MPEIPFHVEKYDKYDGTNCLNFKIISTDRKSELL